MSDIVGPGEDRHERLVVNMRVLSGSTMRIETGTAMKIAFLELTSRSLGEASELETHHFALTGPQLIWLTDQLLERGVQIWGPDGSER